MPRASKRKLSQEIALEIDNEFVNLISTLNTTHETSEFLINFLTDEEKMMLSKRLMLHLMLEKHYSTSNIERILLMSRDTVGKHKKSWITGGLTYRQVLQKLIKKKNTKEALKKVESKLDYLKLKLKSSRRMKVEAKKLAR